MCSNSTSCTAGATSCSFLQALRHEARGPGTLVPSPPPHSVSELELCCPRVHNPDSSLHRTRSPQPQSAQVEPQDLENFREKMNRRKQLLHFLRAAICMAYELSSLHPLLSNLLKGGVHSLETWALT